MKDEWDADLRALRATQDDLRRRLEAIDERISQFQKRVQGAEKPPVVQIGPPLHPPEELRSELAPKPIKPASWAPDQIPEPKHILPKGPPPLPEESPPPIPPVSNGPEENLELRVGKYWLVRVGILVLLTGLVLLGNLAYQTFITALGPAGKLGLLYLVGGLLVGSGLVLEKRLAQMRNYARVLLAGGAGTIYYTTYAAHFVTPLRVIESSFLGGGLLLLLAGILVWLSERRRSQGVAFTAILLSYYTAAINPAGEFTLFSNLLLSGVAVFLLIRHRWFGVSWLCLVGSYVSFAYWRWHAGGSGLGPDVSSIWLSHGFLPAYWTIFTLAVFFQRAETFRATHRVLFLSANNLAFFALFAPALAKISPGQFWVLAVVFGTLLLGLAALACRIKKEAPSFDGAYLVQGLIILTIGLAAKFSGYHLGLILALESSVLMFSSQFRHRILYQTASFLAGAGSFFLVLEFLSLSTPNAWVVAAVVAGILIGNAWLMKKIGGTLSVLQWELAPAVSATAGLFLVGVALADRWEDQALMGAWILAGLGLTFSLRWHRLPELAVGAQGFLVGGAALLFLTLLQEGVTWSTGLPALAGALMLMHWWQRQTTMSPLAARFFEAFDAFVFCAMLMMWLAPSGNEAGEMVILTGVGLGVLAYGFLTRAWFLAAWSQGFTAIGVLVFFYFLLEKEPAWSITLSAIFLTALQASAGRLIPQAGRVGLKIVFQAYRILILIMSISWIVDIVSPSLRMFVLTLLGGLVFLPAAVKTSREYLTYAAVLTGLGLVFFAWGTLQGAPVSGYNVIGLLLLLALAQIGKHLLRDFQESVVSFHAGISIAAILGLWLEASLWIWTGETSLAITIVWALLAFALLGAGFLLRERVWRLMGLLILAVSVGHVFFVDVWKMGQFAGILGIIGLALVLLFLGFIYNRFASQIKKWI